MKWITQLQRVYSNEIGFLTTNALYDYIWHQNVILATIDNRPIAYLAGQRALHWQPLLRPIAQIAVTPGHHGLHIATTLLHAHRRHAIAAGQIGLQAICRANIPANKFWQCSGFKAICHLTPPTARRVPLIVWRLPLTDKIPLWFANPPQRAGKHGRTPQPAQRKGVQHAGHNPARWILPVGKYPTTTKAKTPPPTRRIPKRQSQKKA